MFLEEKKKTILISNRESNCRDEKWKQFTRKNLLQPHMYATTTKDGGKSKSK
jgi:hypothetical protein